MVRDPRVADFIDKELRHRIIWNPKDAIRTAEGDIKCLKCVETDTRKVMLRVLGKDHPSSRTKEG
jgi:hypothetical protein